MPALEDRSTAARDPLRVIAPVLLAVLGAGCGASVFARGFYEITVWGPITIGLLALLLVLVVAAPSRMRGPAAVAFAALVVLWLWSWISVSWAESSEQADLATGRWALYAAVFALFLLLLRSSRDRALLLGFTAAGVLAVALYVALTMRFGDGSSLFFAGRLRDPLGYPNGQAGYFLVGLWPFVALAEMARKPLLAGVGMAGAFLIASLLLVGQTRGVLPGVAVSAAAVLLLVPGRGRRLWVLIVLGAALALFSDPLLDVYREGPPSRDARLPDALTHPAADVMLLGMVGLGLIWAAVQFLISGPLRKATERSGTGRALDHLAAGAAVILLAVVAVGAYAAVDDPTGKVKEQYDEFVNLKVQDKRTDSRFFSGGGYRYDYWRVAWKQFEDNPLKGLGAGNYDRTYFLERRTSEDIRQPHSLPLQTLAELGLAGGIALLALIVAVLVGVWAHARRGREREHDLERAVAAGAGGAFIAWLAHTSVDWLHVVPGITGIALVGAAVLLAPWVSPARAPFRNRVRLVATAAAAIAVLAATQTVAKPTAVESLRDDAQDVLAADPVKALEHANQALDINGSSMRALYAKSAAYARLDDYGKARAALLEAARTEPHDHVPWALLGDLAARRGELAPARRYYRRSLRLNPRYSRLKELIADPRIAVARKG